MQSIEDLIPGKWEGTQEYLVQCPFCGDHPTHDHCYINVVKKIFHCYYCGEKGRLEKILKGVKEVEVTERQRTYEKKKHSPINVDRFLKVSADDIGPLNNAAFKYLKERGLDERDIKKYDIRFGASGRYYGRIVFPIHENGEIVCLSSRSFLDDVKPKYLFPHYGETRLTSSEALFGYDRIASDENPEDVIIVEGAFDAIAVEKRTGIHGLAILSKYMSKGQLEKILKLPRDITFFVMLDADARSDTIKIARELISSGRQTYAVFLDDGDPDSISNDDLIEAFQNAIEASEELEIRALLDDL